MKTKQGCYIGKQIGDYIIVAKNKDGNRIKYLIKCIICGVEKWSYNAQSQMHGTYCEGRNFKKGSSMVNRCFGDYIVLRKIVKSKRSAYIIKCIVCGSTKTVYNLREESHNESCGYFTTYIKGQIRGDFMIIEAYREDRIYVDIKCLICGAISNRISYKQFKLHRKNKHDKQCTIRQIKDYTNIELVKKLLRTYHNINSRLRLDPSYYDVKNIFNTPAEFVHRLYNEFQYRITNEKIPIHFLSVDRINVFGDYAPDNVRCLTLTEQQYNKRIHYKIENMEIKIKRITDWNLVLDSALWTVNKKGLDKEPSDKFKRAIVMSEHSPLRELRYHIEMKGIPNFSSQQISRHDNFAGHSHRDASKDQNYVGTSRSDKSDKKDKEVNRLTPIDHKISLSAQDFIELSKKRLCKLASKETREVWQAVIEELKEIDPILASACVPTCIYRSFCPEHYSCGYTDSLRFTREREEYLKLTTKK